ncbi:MAG: DUF2244 domain-containing protein [Pseudomonadota bacterium]
MLNGDNQFRAVLYPHRSLGPTGFLVVMALVGGVMGIAALRALALGAWPVAIFAVADVLLVYVCFRLSYRAGRQFEEVTVDGSEVRVRKVTPQGRITEHAFNPYWARLKVTRDEEEGVTRLDLGAHGRWIVLGAFLNPGDRESFAAAFSSALDRVRAGDAAV